MKRSNETTKLVPGQKVTYSGYPGRVLELYSDDGPTEACRMYNVRLQSGEICVCGSDLETVS